MKDLLVLLLSLITELLYWIFKSIRQYIANSEYINNTDHRTAELEDWSKPANKKPLFPASYPVLPQAAAPIATSQPISIQQTPSSLPTPTLPRTSNNVCGNQLERKLAQYNSLQKAIIIQAILNPTYRS